MLLAGLASACSLLTPSYTADQPGPSGKAPVEVTLDITGNAGLGAAALRRRVEDFMFDLSREPTRESAAYDAALEVEDFYRTQGYPVARVRYVYTPPAEDGPWPASVRVLLEVEEGPLVTADMTLSGNVAHTADELLSLWSRQRTGALSLGGIAFVEAQVLTFVEQLRAFYRAKARLDAVVSPARITVDLERAVATIRIEIQEGNVHTIRSVDVAAALHTALRTSLGSRLPTPPVGRPHTESELQAYRDTLRKALRHAGHWQPRLEVVARPIADVPHAWHLDVSGDPGPQVTVHSVAVTGNVKTMDGIVLGKLELAPGDRYDGDKIDEAMLRLYRSGLFRKVLIAETPLAGDPSRLELTIQVEENDSRSIEFLAGWGSYEQLRAGLRLEDSNLFGTGRGLALDNRASIKGYSTELTLTDVDFLNTSSTLTVSGEYFRREEPSYTDEALGGTTALARQLAPGLTARGGYTYLDRTDATAFTALPQDQLVDFVEGKVFVELRHDRRDNVLFPKHGHTQFLLFERLAPELGASVDLDRMTFRAANHVALSTALNLVLRAEASALWPHEGSAQVPLQLRWFNGGESTVRSFRESELGPKDVQGEPTGGEYRNIFGAELRVPLTETIEAGLFADAGNVGSKVQEYSLHEMRYGLGAGVRLLLPIGPVRVDAAWNPDQQPGDDEWVVHFSIGYPF